MKAKRRVPALQAERPVILAVNGSAAIEFRCRSASVRRKITPNGPGIGEMSASTSQHGLIAEKSRPRAGDIQEREPAWLNLTLLNG